MSAKRIKSLLIGAGLGGVIFMGATAVADELIGPIIVGLIRLPALTESTLWVLFVPLLVQWFLVFAAFILAAKVLEHAGLDAQEVGSYSGAIFNPLTAIAAGALYFLFDLKGVFRVLPGPALYRQIAGDMTDTLWLLVTFGSIVLPLAAWVAAGGALGHKARKAKTMFDRYTEPARRTIFYARNEAVQLGSPYIETEHLLLGLMREDPARVGRQLEASGAFESIRKQVEERYKETAKASPQRDLPLSHACKRVLACAAEEANQLNHEHIGTEHLLLGVLREENSFAAELLREHAVPDLASLRANRRSEVFGLDDKRLVGLRGAYRAALDLGPLFAKLQAEIGKKAAWEPLWQELYHQGDVGEASYAAAPHIVRIYRASGVTDWNAYALVATIELARTQAGNPALPGWLHEAYFDAVRALAETGLDQLRQASDKETVRGILAILALWKGARVYARLLVELTEDELQEVEQQAFGDER